MEKQEFKKTKKEIRNEKLKQEISAEITTLEKTAESVGFTEKASRRVSYLYKQLGELK